LAGIPLLVLVNKHYLLSAMTATEVGHIPRSRALRRGSCGCRCCRPALNTASRRLQRSDTITRARLSSDRDHTSSRGQYKSELVLSLAIPGLSNLPKVLKRGRSYSSSEGSVSREQGRASTSNAYGCCSCPVLNVED
jgi:hypothetical protein